MISYYFSYLHRKPTSNKSMIIICQLFKKNFMINSVRSFFKDYEHHRCILTLIHVNIPVVHTVKQTGDNRVQRSKPRLFGKKTCFCQGSRKVGCKSTFRKPSTETAALRSV